MAFGSFVSPTRGFGGLSFANPANTAWGSYLGSGLSEQDATRLGLNGTMGGNTQAAEDEAWGRFLGMNRNLMGPGAYNALMNQRLMFNNAFNQSRNLPGAPQTFAQFLGGVDPNSTYNAMSPYQAGRQAIDQYMRYRTQ